MQTSKKLNTKASRSSGTKLGKSLVLATVALFLQGCAEFSVDDQDRTYHQLRALQGLSQSIHRQNAPRVPLYLQGGNVSRQPARRQQPSSSYRPNPSNTNNPSQYFLDNGFGN